MNKPNPFFSIITPLYNQEVRIRRCIESVLGQSFGDFEHIIVNDGSTDHSYEVAHRYAQSDARIKLFSQENKGSSIAYNVGLSKASGEYFIILDNDDWLEPETLKALMTYIRKYGSPDVIQMGVRLYYENESAASRSWVFCDAPILCSGEQRNELFCRFKEKLINTNILPKSFFYI